MHAADSERLLAWDDRTGLVPGPATAAADGLLAADSWLVEDGRVRGLERHAARFSRACGQAAPHLGGVERFWRHAVAELPRSGAWFPRVELRTGNTLGLRLRPAPTRQQTIRAMIWDRPDPRVVPGRKGPDLHRLAQLKARAVAAGADDALMTAPDGRLTESTTASLLWWEEDVLCTPDAPGDLLPGVTTALITEEARKRGITVRVRRVTPADLDGREAWLVNALHGIRPVAEWVGTDLRPGPAVRAPHWRRVLDSLALPLPSPERRSLPAV
ncbi:aminotransferase class IV [Streptomyces sp. NPDC051207]|uniref:aminotransferase class IV n=1 Tax=Streptomyces sp. NPDC051207 TaxID=3154641 RepID=UPI0034217104